MNNQEHFINIIFDNKVETQHPTNEKAPDVSIMTRKGKEMGAKTVNGIVRLYIDEKHT